MPQVRFAAVGLNHAHIHDQVKLLQAAGARLDAFFAPEVDLAAQFAASYPDARRAGSLAEILEDETIHLVTTAGIPNERATLGIEVMRHGKDFFSDKPGVTTLEDLAEVRRVQAETERIYSIYYGERLLNPASVRAGELVRAGAIGQVVQTIGLGPHRASLAARPPWFFKRSQYGGIIADIGSHQCEQFLYFTGSATATVDSSHVANFAHPRYPELEDYGEATVRGDNGARGHIRVDWFTPDALDTFGDARLTVLGTEGYLEVRKYCDIAGRPGGNHLFVVDNKETRYLDCSGVECPFGRQLVEDLRNRTETAMSQTHCFAATELALRAQARATHGGSLAEAAQVAGAPPQSQ